MTPQTRNYILAYIATVAAMHAISGPWKHWSRGRTIDPWTGTHVLWGIIAERMNVPFDTYMALATLNEGVEAGARYIHKNTNVKLLWGEPESAANVAADLAANAVGYWASQRIFS